MLFIQIVRISNNIASFKIFSSFDAIYQKIEKFHKKNIFLINLLAHNRPIALKYQFSAFWIN